MSSKTQEKKRKVIRTAAVPSSLYGLLKGQLQFLNEQYEVIGVASKGDLLEATSKREGIRTHGIDIERNISPLKDLVSLIRLYRFFHKEKPFIVHSITPKAGLLSMTAAYFAGVPNRLHTFTGLIFPTQTGFKKQLLLFFDKLICRMATCIYPEGEGVKEDLLKYRATKKPLHVLANGNVNGINLEWFDLERIDSNTQKALQKKWNIDPHDLTFVYVGRMVNDKGVNELTKAFEKLSQQHKNVTLIMVGSHEGETDLLPEATWNTIRSLNKMVCVGQQTDIRPFLAMADVFVFPSYREGFPNVVLEAGAMGLPCIVTDINGSNEIIVEGINGLIIPSKNEEALFKTMLKMLADKELVKRTKTKAREMIAKRYDRQVVWKAVLNAYQRLEKKPPRI